MFTLLHGFDQAGHYEHVYEGVNQLRFPKLKQQRGCSWHHDEERLLAGMNPFE